MRERHKIRLRRIDDESRAAPGVRRAAYRAWYRGKSVGKIYARAARGKLVWIVWQDNHGHEAKGSYARRGDAKRALLRAVVEFRRQYPTIYGAP